MSSQTRQIITLFPFLITGPLEFAEFARRITLPGVSAAITFSTATFSSLAHGGLVFRQQHHRLGLQGKDVLLSTEPCAFSPVTI
jgi:hypothetical protein